MRDSDKDPTHTLFQMRLPPELHARFSAAARWQDLPMSYIARRLFEREIERCEILRIAQASPRAPAQKKKQRRA